MASGPLGPAGHLWLRGGLDDAALAPLDALGWDGSAGARLGGGLSRLLAPLSAALTPHFGAVWPVRVVAFDKQVKANWSVPWHRDEIIAVAALADMPGFDAWSCKGGVWHCRPPEAILREMLFCRLFLDDVGAEDGGMEFAPGSHLGPHKTGDAPNGAPELERASRGDILVLDMRTVHRSRPSTRPGRRRVLRVDMARAPLPAPLAWARP
ncbi:MAG: phytanoyl-CoA dioxygenase family protein [Pseudomonadota bacterium]